MVAYVAITVQLPGVLGRALINMNNSHQCIMLCFPLFKHADQCLYGPQSDSGNALQAALFPSLATVCVLLWSGNAKILLPDGPLCVFIRQPSW